MAVAFVSTRYELLCLYCNQEYFQRLVLALRHGIDQLQADIDTNIHGIPQKMLMLEWIKAHDLAMEEECKQGERLQIDQLYQENVDWLQRSRRRWGIFK